MDFHIPLTFPWESHLSGGPKDGTLRAASVVLSAAALNSNISAGWQIAAEKEHEDSPGMMKVVDNQLSDILRINNPSNSGKQGDFPWFPKTDLRMNQSQSLTTQAADWAERKEFIEGRLNELQLYLIGIGWKTQLHSPKYKVDYAPRWICESEISHVEPRSYIARLQGLSFKFWPSMNKDTETYISPFNVYRSTRMDHSIKRNTLRPIPNPSRLPVPSASSLDKTTNQPDPGGWYLLKQETNQCSV
ncbi:uncharacterized protein LACBIDRAFT_324768 [Laccaria bicolor S238N-H82]|uniref:Predicted protein n=1 Tax=Laccaria bicolor (strain S238N-H82 / ATCC MYA-4686) TaxID=486041 RepID=B0D2Z5_LACBS|nr:uncharacterized protein LACBIDRAFT_324768 [Laccaria bicolor S238N-H82]EDR11182.1 predicted protein [Laccaria bicolor S238N-H82]|eukprot:XP_001878483.1 predicted protein [Laccaria bicolor S238N-H82]